MKTRFSPSKGFTLLELLIVMTIIAVLAGGIFSAAQSALKKTRDLQARNMAIGLVSGITKFRADYTRWPVPAGGGSTDIQNLESNGEVIEYLLGKTAEAQTINTSGINYIDSMPLAKDNRNGITYKNNGQEGDITDPWGNPYYIAIDKDGNNELDNPEGGADKLYNIKVAVYSKGNDKEIGAEKNTDNVRSW